MGYLWRVRLSSFAAGAATASAAGFFLLYKDHLFTRAAITRQIIALVVRLIKASAIFLMLEDSGTDLMRFHELLKNLEYTFGSVDQKCQPVGVEEIKESSEKHYEALNKRILSLETPEEPEAIKEISECSIS